MCKQLFNYLKQEGVTVYNLHFNGYWIECNKEDIPEKPGIYCVYECSYNKVLGTVSIKNLIYIGESENVCQSILNHEGNKDWDLLLRPGFQLCYNFAEANAYDLKRIITAFIFRHKPIANKKCQDNFPFEKTIIRSTGATALLSDYFRVDEQKIP
jgi:hypothetical protein